MQNPSAAFIPFVTSPASASMAQLIQNHPVVAILRNLPTQQALPYAQAAMDGGVTAFEVAMNSPNALQQIALLKDRLGPQAVIGAGTVLSPRMAGEALAAGASFLLSPSADEDTLRYCQGHGVLFLPGVLTPSDVALCLRYGYTTLKLFPAGDFPPGYIKSLQGPFDNTRYVAVGGVNRENAASFIQAGYVGVGVGGGLIDARLVQEQRWDEAARQVEQLTERVNRALGR